MIALLVSLPIEKVYRFLLLLGLLNNRAFRGFQFKYIIDADKPNNYLKSAHPC